MGIHGRCSRITFAPSDLWNFGDFTGQERLTPAHNPQFTGTFLSLRVGGWRDTRKPTESVLPGYDSSLFFVNFQKLLLRASFLVFPQLTIFQIWPECCYVCGHYSQIWTLCR